MKINCQLQECGCGETNCILNKLSNAEGSIVVSTLDEFIHAKDIAEFTFTVDSDNSSFTIMKYQLYNFQIPTA